jgi:hypothetical protein
MLQPMLLLTPSVSGLFKWRQFEPEMILLAIPLVVSAFHSSTVTSRNKRYGPELERNRLLLLCDSHGFAERRLNFSLIRPDVRKKHTAEPMQLRKRNALLKFFSHCFGLVYCLKSFRGAIR